MKNVGENIRLVRIKRGLNQAELAKISGKTQATISEIEAGKRTGGLPTLMAIAKALGITLEEITGENANKASEEVGDYGGNEDFFDQLKYLWRTGTDKQRADIVKSINLIYGDRAEYWLNLVKKSD